ncbi:IclR family transcriptional regulator [Microbacterium capsulatum]|uniref:IclR family transcriptional regulator n=1 Tax=Microbacterium capsulatum TaxID=3041921 RepID=A0ABU0XH77_9MICO|nr:IclR family transcriptional regulator [Microbacterium sp. ASV81]MDQ4214484.1 IclR family transcriptional regulator [Microbacterium sp. ASV81]
MSQSVKRAAAILDAIATRPKTVAQLAEEFGLHRSTMFRELQSLEEVGYARRRQDGTFTLGFHLVSLAQASLDNLDLREAASAHVRALHEVLGNTLHVAALMGDTIVYVDKVEDPAGVRMYSRIGSRVLPHCTAVGKAILADLDVPRRDALLADTDWTPHTERTITTRAALDAELEIVAARGWAVDDAEFEDFVNCVAVPIRTPAGVVGALSMTAIRMVHDVEQITRRVPLLQKTAARIARELG